MRPGAAILSSNRCGRESIVPGGRLWCGHMNDTLKERLGLFGQHGYDRSLVGMEVLEAEGGRARARLPVGEPVQNLGGALHGG
ncbi:hypothetical protein STIAU_4912, partial [Stigmatella aurantiaca DW4/3-1]